MSDDKSSENKRLYVEQIKDPQPDEIERLADLKKALDLPLEQGLTRGFSKKWKKAGKDASNILENLIIKPKDGGHGK